MRQRASIPLSSTANLFEFKKMEHKEMMRRLLSITFLIALPLVSVFAQQKTDYSGTWKLNVAKSDFGVLPGPSSRTDVITHKEPSITNHVTAEGEQGKLDYTVSYSTDGKEVTNTVAERVSKSTAKWDGNNLVVNTKLMLKSSTPGCSPLTARHSPSARTSPAAWAIPIKS
jgi:hypothetical protein